MICPKCGKEGRFGYFDVPDKTGIIAMFTHRTGIYEKVKDMFGSERLVEKEERHYLTLADLEKTSWFKDWKAKRDEEGKRLLEERLIKMDKLYEEEYWKEVEREM